METLKVFQDPVMENIILVALFLVNGVLTISLILKSLDPVRLDGLCAGAISIGVFILCANLSSRDASSLIMMQFSQMLILLILNYLFRRDPLGRG